MTRLLLLLLGLYGVRLSRGASDTIDQLGRQSTAGDAGARTHFTQTRYARVLGVKNSDLGTLFYGAVALAAVTGAIQRRWVSRLLWIGSWCSLAMSAYLLWALASRLRVWCEVCMKGHALNMVTWLLLRRTLTRKSP